jgi:putative sigma-54 modulation protein
MNIAITFRQMEATDAMRGYATDKISKLQKFLRQPMKGHVTLSLENRTQTAEVDIHSGGEHYHATERSEDMYASIDKVADKLERQIREMHGAASARKKGAERASERLLNDESGEE